MMARKVNCWRGLLTVAALGTIHIGCAPTRCARMQDPTNPAVTTCSDVRMTEREAALTDRMLEDERAFTAGKVVPAANCQFWRTKLAEHERNSYDQGLKRYIQRAHDYECSRAEQDEIRKREEEPRRRAAEQELQARQMATAKEELSQGSCNTEHRERLDRWLQEIRIGMRLKFSGEIAEIYELGSKEVVVGSGEPSSIPLRLAKDIDIDIDVFAYAWQPIEVSVEGQSSETTKSPWAHLEHRRYTLDGLWSQKLSDDRPPYSDSRRFRVNPTSFTGLSVRTLGCALVATFVRIR